MFNFKKLVLLLIVFSVLCAMLLGAQASTQAQSTPPAWAPNVSYSLGTLVTYNGVTYKAIQAHTSLVGWEPPNVPALWQVSTTVPTNTPTKTNTVSPTPACVIATPEYMAVSPVTSPTVSLSQTVYVTLTNGESVTITSEAGTFNGVLVNGKYEVTVLLVPNSVNHLTATGKVRTVVYGNCTYGGYTLTRYVTIQQSGDQPTLTPTKTRTPTATLCPQMGAVVMSVEPVTSPTSATSQVVVVSFPTNAGYSIKISTVSGTFNGTVASNGIYNVTVALNPNTAHNLTVQGTVPPVTIGGCSYSGYTVGRTTDKNNKPLVIVQGNIIPTNTATPVIRPWEPYVSFGLGAMVSHQGQLFRCRQAHMSQPGWEPPNAPALWESMGPVPPTSTPSATQVQTSLSLWGIVRNNSGTAISGAFVSFTSCHPRAFSGTTGADGTYRIFIPGSYACGGFMTVSAPGYATLTQQFTMSDLYSQPVRNFTLAPQTPTVTPTPGNDLTLSGFVFGIPSDGTTPGLVGATVSASTCTAGVNFIATSDSLGHYQVFIPASYLCDTLSISVSGAGFRSTTQTFQTADLRQYPQRNFFLLENF